MGRAGIDGDGVVVVEIGTGPIGVCVGVSVIGGAFVIVIGGSGVVVGGKI
jgi:hypothetical protein